MGAGAVVCSGLFVGGFSVLLQAAPLPALLRAHARGAPIKNRRSSTHVHARPSARAHARTQARKKATPLEKRDAAFFSEPAFA